MYTAVPSEPEALRPKHEIKTSTDVKRASATPNTIHPTSDDLLLSKTQAKIDEVTETTRINLNALVERQDKIDVLEIKSARLNEVSASFYKKSRQMKCKACWQSYKPVLIGFLVLVIIAILLYFAIKGSS